ncbi:cell division topological specificity factor MinE [Candidatus Blochmanniella vafra str. BVAF]|uniref:Cell division topological specificity factor n=1 Tax=Blochmanniella vafra (strain BVAF) TaxID=859654 RepID=E8Q707_BLOVB|nr:cell division topological specificity factor MinE [Candidatus Blochmannia vafer]ADV33831.1 cell division topological specificity factor MinE [Candidatus Blochmannia vafer str. BVAF]
MIILINFFTRKKKLSTANIAKERLHIIIDEHRIKNKFELNSLPKFKHELLEIIHKYIQKPQIISIKLKKHDENTSVLKVNILLSNKKI